LVCQPHSFRHESPRSSSESRVYQSYALASSSLPLLIGNQAASSEFFPGASAKASFVFPWLHHCPDLCHFLSDLPGSTQGGDISFLIFVLHCVNCQWFPMPIGDSLALLAWHPQPCLSLQPTQLPTTPRPQPRAMLVTPVLTESKKDKHTVNEIIKSH